MRIIGGSAGGRHLKVPKGLAVRPTPDLVKQALFNSLGGKVAGAQVLELFAGSGALGLECLSRGAIELVAVEKATRHAEFIRQNLEAAGLNSLAVEVRVQDTLAAVHQLATQGRRFDLILADPPYGEKNLNQRSTSWAQRLLDDEVLPHLLDRNGLFVLGHARRDTLTLTSPWHERKALRHGDSVLRFLFPADAANEAQDTPDGPR
jgi:16S rRNA (guanine966-N2)-methyltransferase